VEAESLSRIFYEVYASREAHARHESTEHTRHFLEQKEQYLTSTRVEFLGLLTARVCHLPLANEQT
jgi:quinol monooxygenase YgiN